MTTSHPPAGTSRRQLLGLGAGAVGATMLLGAGPAPAPAAAAGTTKTAPMRVIALGGSGGPVIHQGCRGVASVVRVGGKNYLIDAGHGTLGQYGDAGLLEKDLESIFITHLHSDHVVDLFAIPWLLHGGARPLTPVLDIYGPGRAGALPPARTEGRNETINTTNPTPGTRDLIEHMILGGAYDLNIRMRDEGAPNIHDIIAVHDIDPPPGANPLTNLTPAMKPFAVYEDDRVKVTATLVAHPPVFPALAYRFDTEHGSAVFSGDTTVCDNLITLARGADVLVHEAIDLNWFRESQNFSPDLQAHLEESHTDVDLVGSVAERAGVRTLMINHLVPGNLNAVKDHEWRKRAQKGFSGTVVVARDLVEVGVGSPR